MDEIYIAALRFVRAYERDELDQGRDEGKLDARTAARLLADACARYARERGEPAGPAA